MTAHRDDAHDAALHFSRPSHPTFARGHCFMVETLSRREVEAVGPIIAAEIARLEAAGEDARHLRRALRKMDYPEPESVYESAARKAGWIEECGGTWRRISRGTGASGQDLLDRVQSAREACAMDANGRTA